VISRRRPQVENNAPAIPIWNSSINCRIAFIISIRNFTQSEVADSSFRTFYFEPKIATNKVREDAVHFIVGFEHEKPAANRGGNSHVGTWSTFHIFR